MAEPRFTAELLDLLTQSIQRGSVVRTLSGGKPNWVVALDADGLLVETERSRGTGTGAQLVPAWMVQAAWERLTTRRTLTNKELIATDDLNVKRSSFVCALLAQLPGVTVTSRRPIALAYDPTQSG